MICIEENIIQFFSLFTVAFSNDCAQFLMVFEIELQKLEKCGTSISLGQGAIEVVAWWV